MKLRKLYFAMAFTAVMLVVLGASAQTVNLTCTSIHNTGYEERLTFNESEGTAAFGDDPVSDAVFTEKTITWGEITTRSYIRQFHKNYSLNRFTGVLTMFGAMKDDNQTKWAATGGTLQCVIEEKKQRKF